jgi:hypothetical protein
MGSSIGFGFVLMSQMRACLSSLMVHMCEGEWGAHAMPFTAAWWPVYMYKCIHDCMYVYMHICMYVCIYKHTYIYLKNKNHVPTSSATGVEGTRISGIYIHMYIYIYMYVYLHIHTYIYIHIYKYI